MIGLSGMATLLDNTVTSLNLPHLTTRNILIRMDPPKISILWKDFEGSPGRNGFTARF